MVMDMDMKNKILFAVAFFVFAAFSVSAQPRKMTVYLVQHVHTDIGYTKPQTEILSEHLRYIDYALDYCDATATYPDDARFRWTCEASWAVDEWLRVRPKEQVERFLEYVDVVKPLCLSWNGFSSHSANSRNLFQTCKLFLSV